jgi:hypothetical protein
MKQKYYSINEITIKRFQLCTFPTVIYSSRIIVHCTNCGGQIITYIDVKPATADKLPHNVDNMFCRIAGEVI